MIYLTFWFADNIKTSLYTYSISQGPHPYTIRVGVSVYKEIDLISFL